MTRLAKVQRATEYKPVLTTEIKAVDQARGILEGYLNVKNVEDLGGDISRDGCFRKTLQESHARKRSQKLQGLWPFLYNHSYESVPPGLVVDSEEDKKGLWIRAQLFMDQEKARDLYGAYAQGGLTSFSMGYKAHQVSWEKINGRQVRNLLEIQIMECSSVLFPMNTDSTVTAIKGRQNYNMLLTKDFNQNFQSAQLGDWQDDFADVANALQASILDCFTAGADPLALFENSVLPQLAEALRSYISEGVTLGYSNVPASAQGVYPSMMSLAGAGGEAKRGYLNAETHAHIHEATTNIMKSAKSIHKALSSLSGSPARGFNARAGTTIYSEASSDDFFEEKESEEDIGSLIKSLTTSLQVSNDLREAKSDLSSDAMTFSPVDAVSRALSALLDKQR